MSIVATKEILGRAFEGRYGVAAFNVVNDLTMEAVLAAAVELNAPLLIQTSVKTVKTAGARVLAAMFREMAGPLPVPVALHLDHCPDRAVLSTCLREGWNSVLFDGSSLPSLEECKRQTVEVVAEASQYGASVEGEIEGIKGVEDGVGTDEGTDIYSLDAALDFIRATGIDYFAPAIGNAHGVYKTTPRLDVQRVSDIVLRCPVPIVLHGGTGISAEQFTDLIGRGCAKVNISTALKIVFLDASRDYLNQNPTRHDPPAFLRHVRDEVKAMAVEYIRMFGSEGKAL